MTLGWTVGRWRLHTLHRSLTAGFRHEPPDSSKRVLVGLVTGLAAQCLPREVGASIHGFNVPVTIPYAQTEIVLF